MDKVVADVILHGCSHRCLPKPVEGLLEVYQDLKEFLLVLEIFLTEDSGPQFLPFSSLLDLVADCRESADYVLSTCLDQFSLFLTFLKILVSHPTPPPFFIEKLSLVGALSRVIYRGLYQV